MNKRNKVGCWFKAALLLFTILLFCASCGTVRTRITAQKQFVVFNGHTTSYQYENGAFFGKYPYQAVTDDIKVMQSTEYVAVFVVALESRPYSRPLDYIAIPFDFVWDTVFLPFDLIGWACGYEKGWNESESRVIDRDYSELPFAKKLVDSQTILNARNNDVARANMIAELQLLLSEPNIRKDNPLEIPNILWGLVHLKALEASSTLVDYMFFDENTGRDFRLIDGDLDVLTGKQSSSARVLSKQHPPTAGSLWCVTWAGTNFVPIVLERFSRATSEERSLQVGGGATPYLAVRYLRYLAPSYVQTTPDQSIALIENFKMSHSELSTNQIEALDEIIDTIHERKYFPKWGVKDEPSKQPGRQQGITPTTTR